MEIEIEFGRRHCSWGLFVVVLCHTIIIASLRLSYKKWWCLSLRVCR